MGGLEILAPPSDAILPTKHTGHNLDMARDLINRKSLWNFATRAYIAVYGPRNPEFDPSEDSAAGGRLCDESGVPNGSAQRSWYTLGPPIQWLISGREYWFCRLLRSPENWPQNPIFAGPCMYTHQSNQLAQRGTKIGCELRTRTCFELAG